MCILPSRLRNARATAKKGQEIELWFILGGIFDYLHWSNFYLPSSIISRENSILIFVCCFYMHLKVFHIVFGIVHHTHLPLHTHTLFHPPTPEIVVFIREIAVHLHGSRR